mmetsp:Transcript_67401/g.161661  ORF Transcript_67401/g.161661 Transcript_67401/m.161661 type:complete len:411 (+) Transcript_67401:59-1291(+)
MLFANCLTRDQWLASWLQSSQACILLFVLGLHLSSAIQPRDKVPEYLATYGIHVENHTIETEDGYLLMAFRLPHHGAPVALMQHGVLSSAWCWIDNEPSLAPALEVYKMGYDVWLTNSRGNTFSRRHKALQPHFSKEFWNFSFPDLGRKDVPANIDYILKHTKQATLSLIGHSQGTSQVFVALTDPSIRNFMQDRVNLFVALSPITYMAKQSAKLFSVLSYLHFGTVCMDLWPLGFLDFASVPEVANELCHLTDGKLCKITVDIICGVSSEDSDAAITNVSAHFPAGTSMKSLDHYAQLISDGGFRDYDYGASGNRKVYGSDTPPSFNLSSAAEVPVALFIGGNDDLGDVADEERAAAELPQASRVFTEVFNDFSHVTWIAGNRQSFQAWFPKMQTLLGKYNPVPKAVVV